MPHADAPLPAAVIALLGYTPNCTKFLGQKSVRAMFNADTHTHTHMLWHGEGSYHVVQPENYPHRVFHQNMIERLQYVCDSAYVSGVLCC